ncbi:MAG: hypothetical protein LBN26_01190 [Christensenellaceae bacterium]|jgi:hypothetical protein|nr:hypothetical protein [Christensenellaceae bacterium]
MLEFSGVGLTDEINLYGHKFSIEGMYSAYEDTWEEGVPSFLNHDHRKHLGWTKLSGLYLEPHKAYLMNSILIGESETERSKLQELSYKQLYDKRVVSQQDKYDELRDKLGDSLSAEASKPCWVNAVAYYDVGIVQRIIPNIATDLIKGLMPLSKLKYIQPGVYEKDGWLLFAHLYFRRGLSYLNTLNEPFFELLQKCDERVNPRIAIDLNCIGLAGTQSQELEYSYWWGPKFNDDLSKIPDGVAVYKNEHYDGLLSDVLQTEFGWYRQDGIQTFECEEVTDIANIDISSNEKYGCRFVHSMINADTGLPTHLDGAIRAYTTEEMVARLDQDIKHSGRHTGYTKLWRIDGDIESPLWKSLITNFYRDNMQVGEYFGGTDSKLDLRHTRRDNTLSSHADFSVKSFIPANMSAGDGVRISVKCVPLESFPDGYDILIRPAQIYMAKDGAKKFIEGDTVSIAKYLKQLGLNVRIPFCARVATEDMVYNFPVFVCRDSFIANQVVECFRRFSEAWKSNGDDRLLSYSIQVNYDNYCVQYSFAGHIDDFCDYYLSSQKNIPSSDSDIPSWLNSLSEFLKSYHPANNSPSHADLRGKNGVLLFPKLLVNKKYIDKLEPDDVGVWAWLKLEKDQYEVVRDNGIWICAMFEIKQSKCSVCGKSYEKCDCIKLLEANVTEEIVDANFLGVIWTNRSAICCPPDINEKQRIEV